MEFPRDGMELLWVQAPNARLAGIVRQAIKAYDELSLRCVEDNTKHSLTIAGLRARIAELEASHSPKP